MAENVENHRCLQNEDIGKNVGISIFIRLQNFNKTRKNHQIFIKMPQNVEIHRCLHFRCLENEDTNNNSLNNIIYLIANYI